MHIASLDREDRPRVNVFVQQPYLLPWVGFWNKYLTADVYVAFAGVQYGPRQFIKRVLLDGAWFGLPIVDYHQGQLLSEARFDLGALPRAVRRLRSTLTGKGYPYADRVAPVIEAFESYRGSPRVIDVDLHLIEIVREVLGISRRSTVVDENPRLGQTATMRVCAAALLGSSGRPVNYLSGMMGVNYLQLEEVAEGVDIYVQTVSVTAPRGTILEVIAKEADPLMIVRDCAEWHPLEFVLSAKSGTDGIAGTVEA